MQANHRPWLTMVLTGLLAGVAAGQPPPPAPPGGTPPVPPVGAVLAGQPADKAVAATVNGQPIAEVAVRRALRSVPKDKQPEVRPDVLSFLIDNMLVDQWLVGEKVVVGIKEIEDRLAEVKQQLTKDKVDFAKVLADMMLTEAELRETIAAELRWQKYVDAQATDRALQELFTQHPDMFDGSLVRARHILLTPSANDPKTVEQFRQQLRAIRKQIEDTVAAGLAKLPANTDAGARETARARLIDEAFAAQARQHSACPSSKQGGDVDWFPRAGSMVEPFAKAAFALKPFEMSDVVQTQFGLHLILPTDRKTGRTGVKFEDIKEDVKDVLSSRLREMLCERLRAGATIVVK